MIFDNVLEKCKEDKINVYTLEKKAGLGRGTIGKWRINSPNVQSLKKVADYFGCTVDELLKED